ncbi:MAG TPA: HAD family hydrolase [Candidatus Acidoferrales bacterium]|nr:HAD family hydrolase [Candidatus Acidoferrales bacterium]
MKNESFPERISTILFDVGNTLHHIDHEFIATRVCEHSHRVSAHDVRSAELSAKRAIDALFRARRGGNDTTRQLGYFETMMDTLAVPEDAAARVIEDLHAENARSSLWRVMHADTPRVLGELGRRGFKLGVVSNADGRVAGSLAASGIAEHFICIIDSHVVGVEKPQARIFEIALDACGTSAAESIYIGDIYEIDVCGARAAGLNPVLLDPLDHYDDADCLRVRSLAELLELLPETAPTKSRQ